MSVVARVYRGDLVDWTHSGHVGVVDHTGKLLYYYGDPKRVTFARSSAKPMQAIPVVESGAVDAYGIDERELALFCASHSGENFHVDTVRSILGKAGLSDKYLQCGTHYPYAAYAADELKRQGLLPETVHCNCSGKHSGMLITAKYLGEDLDTYYRPEHPVQKRIMKTISEICQYEEEKIITAVDGCGVPVHAMPLDKFAQGYARLTMPELLGEKRGQVVRRITSAMTAHPQMVGGTDRFCTDLMSVCGDRLFAKAGAAAYYAVGLKDRGIGMSFKVEDATERIGFAMVLEVLRQLDIITPNEFKKLEKYHALQDKNHKGEVVGHTEVGFELIKG